MKWDEVAHKAYGDAHRDVDLMEANPQIPVYDYIPEGVYVICPETLDADIIPSPDVLPAWKVE